MRKNTDRAFLGFALMWREEEFLLKAKENLLSEYGSILSQSEIFNPPVSKYYQREMGFPLLKRFIITDRVIDKSEIKGIKKLCMEIEDSFRINGSRTVNIDPFYIDPDQLVVSTKKYRGNRIYLGDGVYAELELFYHHGSFQPFIWTYLDYKQQIPFFNSVRNFLKL
ncbi:DUF4416 family protein [Persephonella atlantica]|uniref:DUF4416 family protein n=1 Tax=Persephonella atlantica TaxID=2699429 RepID=A0ABS1GFW5_9AQUI|nr:DUF4416 family protein [Persephonella atlantica]